MPDPIRIRAVANNGITEVKVLMSHPMEGGLREDKEGSAIPAHFITDVTATHANKTVLQCLWSQSASQYPFLAFKFKGGLAGEKVAVSWVDNKGEKRTGEGTIS